jgi:hypothetical protein
VGDAKNKRKSPEFLRGLKNLKGITEQIASSNACPSGAIATQAGVLTPGQKKPVPQNCGTGFFVRLVVFYT